MARDNVAEVYARPVVLLTIHLAAVTKPSGTWDALPYSETRFDCPYAEEDEGFRETGQGRLVPVPTLLWSLEVKREIITQQEGLYNNV